MSTMAQVHGSMAVSMFCGLASWLLASVIISNMSSASSQACLQLATEGVPTRGPPSAQQGISSSTGSQAQALVCAVQLLQGGTTGLGAWGLALLKMCAALIGVWASLLSAEERHCFEGWMTACTPALWHTERETEAPRHVDAGWGLSSRRLGLPRPRRGVSPVLVLSAMLSAGCGLMVCAWLMSAALDNPSPGARQMYTAGSHAVYLLEQLQGACHMPVAASNVDEARQPTHTLPSAAGASQQEKAKGSKRAKAAAVMTQEELQEAWMGLQTAHTDHVVADEAWRSGSRGRDAGSWQPQSSRHNSLTEQSSAHAQKNPNGFPRVRVLGRRPRNAIESSGVDGAVDSQGLGTWQSRTEAHVAGLPSSDGALRQKLCQAQLHGHRLWDSPLTADEVRRLSVPEVAVRLWGHAPAVLVARARLKEVLDAFWGPWDGIQDVCTRAWRHRDGLDILAVLFIAPFLLAFAMLVLAAGLACLHVTTIWLHLFLTPSMITLGVVVSLSTMAWAHAHSSAQEALQRPHGTSSGRRMRRGLCGSTLRLLCPKVKNTADNQAPDSDTSLDQSSDWKAFLVPQGGVPTVPSPSSGGQHDEDGMPAGQTTDEGWASSSVGDDRRQRQQVERETILQMLPAPSSSWQAIIVEAVGSGRFQDVCSVCLDSFTSTPSKSAAQSSREHRDHHIRFHTPVCLCACSHAIHAHCADTWNSIRASGSAPGQTSTLHMPLHVPSTSRAEVAGHESADAHNRYTGVTSMSSAGGFGVGLASSSGTARLRASAQAHASSHAIDVLQDTAAAHRASLGSASIRAGSPSGRHANTSLPTARFVPTAAGPRPHTPRPSSSPQGAILGAGGLHTEAEVYHDRDSNNGVPMLDADILGLGHATFLAGQNIPGVYANGQGQAAGQATAEGLVPSPAALHTQAQDRRPVDHSSDDTDDSSTESSSHVDDASDTTEQSLASLDQAEEDGMSTDSGYALRGMMSHAAAPSVPHGSSDVASTAGSRAGRRMSGVGAVLGVAVHAHAAVGTESSLGSIPQHAERSSGLQGPDPSSAQGLASGQARSNRRHGSAFSLSRWCRRTCSLRRARHIVMPILYYAFLLISHPIALLLHHLQWLFGCLSILVHACTRAISSTVVQPMPMAYVQSGRARGTLTGPPAEHQQIGGQPGYLSPIFNVLQFLWGLVYAVLCPCRTRNKTGEGDPTKCPVCRAEVATLRVSELMIVRSDIPDRLS